MNFKIITMRCVMMNRLSRKKRKILEKVSFVALSIEVYDIKSTTTLSYERDGFPFHISLMPYLDSNTPSKIFYASVSSGISFSYQSHAIFRQKYTIQNILSFSQFWNFAYCQGSYRLDSYGKILNFRRILFYLFVGYECKLQRN